MSSPQSPANNINNGPDPSSQPPGSQSPQDRHTAQDERYREQLRAAESERDALRQRVTRYQQAEVAGLVKGKLMDESDIWVFGKLEDFRDENGDVSREKVDSAIEELLMHKPYLAPPPPPVPTFGQGSGTKPSLAEEEWSLGKLIDPYRETRGTSTAETPQNPGRWG